MSQVKLLIRLMRPHQWLKNGFVLIGLLFGHAWHDPARLLQALYAFAIFCLLASAVYVMNDLIDREQDRKHPTKRHRPLASERQVMHRLLGVGSSSRPVQVVG